MISNSLGLVAIIGGVLLAVALLWAYLRNRATPDRDRARTERATRDLYKDESRAERAREDGAP